MLTHINSNITSMEGMDSSIQRISRQVILETNQVLEGIAFVYYLWRQGETPLPKKKNLAGESGIGELVSIPRNLIFDKMTWVNQILLGAYCSAKVYKMLTSTAYKVSIFLFFW